MNNCGVSPWYIKTIPIDCSGGPTQLRTTPDTNEESIEVLIYPNPAKGKINVKISGEINYGTGLLPVIHAIQIRDQYNTLRNYEFKKQSSSQEFDVSYLKPGLYYLVIGTAHGNYTKKLLVN